MSNSNPNIASHPGLPPPPPPSSSSSSSSTIAAASPIKRFNHPPPPSEEVAAIDTRIHLDQKSNKWAYEDQDGNEWEWDQSMNGGNGNWIPVLNDDFVRAQQMAYAREGVDDEVSRMNSQRLMKRVEE